MQILFMKTIEITEIVFSFTPIPGSKKLSNVCVNKLIMILVVLRFVSGWEYIVSFLYTKLILFRILFRGNCLIIDLKLLSPTRKPIKYLMQTCKFIEVLTPNFNHNLTSLKLLEPETNDSTSKAGLLFFSDMLTWGQKFGWTLVLMKYSFSFDFASTDKNSFKTYKQRLSPTDTSEAPYNLTERKKSAL